MAGTLTIHYGLMGTGKTLFAMQDIILPCVREHRPFFTNISGISLSGISGITGVHQSMIKYYPVNDITDVIAYFDNNAISHDGVFVLDEMKDFIDNDKAVSWLESRINITRKMGVDFVLIAQQPKKNYIHPDIIELAQSCNVFVRGKMFARGDKSHTEQYFVNGGMPRIVDGAPTNATKCDRRTLAKEIFSCYKTSESEFYKGKENDSYRGAMWWQTRKWKFRFWIIGLFTVTAIIGVLLIVGLWDSTAGIFGDKEKVGKNDVQQQSTAVAVQSRSTPGASADAPKCFGYIICDTYDCWTDIGTYPAQSYNEDDGTLCGVPDAGCLRKCERVQDVPDGGGLLHLGGKILAN